MCKCNGESVDHLLLNCPIGLDLWSMILVLFGLSWVMPKSVFELLACWQGCFGCHRNGHIWRERNSRSFEDIESYLPNLKLFIFRTLLDWLTAIRNFSLFSTVDLLDLCNFCDWLSTPVYFLYTWVTPLSDLYNLIAYKNKNNYKNKIK